MVSASATHPFVDRKDALRKYWSTFGFIATSSHEYRGRENALRQARKCLTAYAFVKRAIREILLKNHIFSIFHDVYFDNVLENVNGVYQQL